MLRRFLLLFFALILAAPAYADQDPDWTTPVAPFRIADNLYYVGSRDLAAYLVTTPAGNILINSNLESSPPLIRASIEKLGFKFSDTKILLISHAHFDHAAGSAQIKALTGAQYMVMQQDVPYVDGSGGALLPGTTIPPAKVDRVLQDGSTVELGGVVLTAHLTPGHTPGCTTWTMRVTDGGKSYNVVIVGSPNVNSVDKLVENRRYPQIVADYETTFRVLYTLPCDIFLGAHGGYFDMLKKLDEPVVPGKNRFVDHAGYIAYVKDREQAFRKELLRQRREFVSHLPTAVPPGVTIK